MAPKKYPRAEASTSRATPQLKTKEAILATYKAWPIVSERGMVIDRPMEGYLCTQE